VLFYAAGILVSRLQVGGEKKQKSLRFSAWVCG